MRSRNSLEDAVEETVSKAPAADQRGTQRGGLLPQWLLKAFSPRPVLRVRGLHSPEQLRAALDRERARADRYGQEFSLLTFELRDAEAKDAGYGPLIAILGNRLRCTDEPGWMDDQRLGVVLLDTPAAGAWKVADDVIAAYPIELTPPHCTVYSYPLARPGSTGSSGGNDSREAGSRDTKLAKSRKTKSRENNRPIKPLEALFACPLPAWKRGLDIVGAAVGLALLSPLLAAAAAAIKLTSPGGVIFSQQRDGLGGRPFTIYKFRTMHVDAEEQKAGLRAVSEQDGPAFKLSNDPRVTRVGRFLRESSIDELPQLWNVLKGDMSLVGPRPLPCDESQACRNWQRQRLDVTPGLTCIWQINGRSTVAFDDWVRMDLAYIRSRTLLFDLKILFWTVPAVLSRKGAK